MTNQVDIAVTSNAGLVSIVVPCCGMLEYTKLCVPNILKHTRTPYELIFLDIGSLDGTAEYLAGLRAGLADRLRMEIVRTPSDLGIRDACQQALKLTLGEYVVLLNNDTIVTNGWLNQLTGLASFSQGIGMVGPMSNMAAPPQLVETVPYRTFTSTSPSPANPSGSLADIAAVEKFADHYRNENRGKWMDTTRLGGFCLLVKRDMLDKLGPALNEVTDLGLFDTDVLSLKAHQAGYSMAVCKDLYVHHFATRTFAHGPAKSGLAGGQTKG